MSVQITLTLPEPLVERAKQFGSATQRDVASILTDSLEMMWPVQSGLPKMTYQPVSELDDQEVLTLAASKMDKVQNDRLGSLQAKGENSNLTPEEQYEL